MDTGTTKIEMKTEKEPHWSFDDTPSRPLMSAETVFVMLTEVTARFLSRKPGTVLVALKNEIMGKNNLLLGFEFFV